MQKTPGAIEGVLVPDAWPEIQNVRMSPTDSRILHFPIIHALQCSGRKLCDHLTIFRLRWWSQVFDQLNRLGGFEARAQSRIARGEANDVP